MGAHRARLVTLSSRPSRGVKICIARKDVDTMVKKKGKSKRTTLKQKYKVEKKKKEHERKVRKEAKRKSGQAFLGKKKRDPGIPNSCPFKKELLAEIVAAKERADDRKKKPKTLKELASIAKEATEKYEPPAKEIVSGATSLLGRTAKAYGKEVSKVVASADVVLEVLDARDPVHSRSPALEDSILPPKRVVLVLNKIDLVPKDVAQRWLRSLRRTSGLAVVATSTKRVQKTDGIDGVLQLLKSLQHSRGGTLAVGIVGFPNAGKSSLAKALAQKRSGADVAVDATAGSTTTAREVRLENKLTLIDSPGVIRDQSSDLASLAARGCIEVSDLDDPQSIARDLLSTEEDPRQYLIHRAQRRGNVKKNGILDLDAAARDVIHDFKIGKLSFFRHPPPDDDDNDALLTDDDGPKLLSTFGPDFDPLANDAKVLDACCLKSPADDDDDDDEMDDADDDDDDAMDDDDDGAFDFKKDFSYK